MNFVSRRTFGHTIYFVEEYGEEDEDVDDDDDDDDDDDNHDDGLGDTPTDKGPNDNADQDQGPNRTLDGGPDVPPSPPKGLPHTDPPTSDPTPTENPKDAAHQDSQALVVYSTAPPSPKGDDVKKGEISVDLEAASFDSEEEKSDSEGDEEGILEINFINPEIPTVVNVADDHEDEEDEPNNSLVTRSKKRSTAKADIP